VSRSKTKWKREGGKEGTEKGIHYMQNVRRSVYGTPAGRSRRLSKWWWLGLCRHRLDVENKLALAVLRSTGPSVDHRRWCCSIGAYKLFLLSWPTRQEHYSSLPRLVATRA